MFKKFYSLLSFFIFVSLSLFVDQPPAKINITPELKYPGDVVAIYAEIPIKPSGIFQNKEIRFYESGLGFKGITYVDIDTKPGDYPLTLNAGELSSTYSIEIRTKEFPVKHITLQSEKVFLSPEDEKRANDESALLKSIWDQVTPVPLWEGSFTKPTDSDITSQFGVKRIINKKKESTHRGTDYRGKTGTPIKSINSGIVELTDNHFYGGNTVVINHGLGLYSVYLHLSKTNVSTGEKINRGDIIGLVGSTGRASGPHLHLSVKLNGESINPESLYILEL
ncbi:MAG: M23 family metallopeptidase [Candidatus Dadabacteria bacterium]|nr:M23 family metallopeptidase [Candidatus Dadabacteria bacterium]NIS07733.1 M23 family metallopeptidase [Candidatus Dadabacteria bacterium]NIV42338.1 peptidoglycan DD-metalloendopeptidase family protein [Candidatus Dadabacteria bacterium]NIY21374.1 peptidoglycan DD-metalloendopeptidase family protein [Candidatus Dadabacteria bacterium]